MIHGVVTLSVSQMRRASESRSSAATTSTAARAGLPTATRTRSGQAAGRTRERSAAAADLPESLGDLAERGTVGVEAGLRGGSCDLLPDGFADGLAAGGLLERRGVG